MLIENFLRVAMANFAGMATTVSVSAAILFIAVLPIAVILGIVILINEKHKKQDYYRQTGKDIIHLVFDKGSYGEYKIGKKLDKVEGYKKIIYNCYIPKSSGETTEVDVIMIHEKGMYVIESKNYSGWIFGSENHTKWTQVLRRGRYGSEKHQFYNPIMQNRSHVKWLNNYLKPVNLDTTMYSCIVFGNSCEFKDITASGQNYTLMYECQLYGTVQRHVACSANRLTPDQIDAIYGRLFPLTQKTEAEKLKHIYDISLHNNERDFDCSNEKLNDSAIIENVSQVIHKPYAVDESSCHKKICPRCGSKMILRTAKKGENVGQQFFGCSNYPKCRYTEKA